jgi:hypothetical protein
MLSSLTQTYSVRIARVEEDHIGSAAGKIVSMLNQTLHRK